MHKIDHAKVSGKTDGSDVSLILPSDWNNTHAISWGIATPNKSTLVAADADTPGDIYWDKVKLSLHFNGVDNSTSIVDDASIPKTVTLNGAAKIRTSADGVSPKFGSGKLYFNGTNSYAQVTAHSDFTIGTSDFTVEFWVYTPVSGAYTLFDMRPLTLNGAYLVLKLSATGVITLNVSSTDRITTSAGVVTANTWTHISLNRTGGTTTLYVDGVSEGTWSDATTYLVNNDYGMRIGLNSTGSSEYYSGYMDEFQFTNGYCRRTAAFSVPTAEYYDSFPTLNMDSTKNYQSAGPITIDTVSVVVPNGTNWVII